MTYAFKHHGPEFPWQKEMNDRLKEILAAFSQLPQDKGFKACSRIPNGHCILGMEPDEIRATVRRLLPTPYTTQEDIDRMAEDAPIECLNKACIELQGLIAATVCEYHEQYGVYTTKKLNATDYTPVMRDGEPAEDFTARKKAYERKINNLNKSNSESTRMSKRMFAILGRMEAAEERQAIQNERSE
ncbi:hypothetical protein C4565_03725 [Candidatus Parcubacteria bacterium]|nr:MAG: hypothetical protein C4565_03725 [Candidatus Parcubacteria bacterium]